MTDHLERRLSAALHDLTPEPPTPYRFAPPAGLDIDDVVLIDIIDPDPDADLARQRRGPRRGALLAVAAVVLLGGGIAVASVAGQRPATGSGPAATSVSVPTCDDDDVVVYTAEPVLARGELRTAVHFGNAGARTCTLTTLPVIGIDRGLHPDRVDYGFPVVTVPTRYLVLANGEELVIDVRMTGATTCRRARPSEVEGLGLAVDTGYGSGETDLLEIVGCQPVPSGLSVRVVR